MCFLGLKDRDCLDCYPGRQSLDEGAFASRLASHAEGNASDSLLVLCNSMGIELLVDRMRPLFYVLLLLGR